MCICKFIVLIVYGQFWYCTAVFCPPVVLKHGSVRISYIDGITFKAELTCDVGYQLVPKEPVLVCHDGHWTPTEPICTSPGE